MILPTTYVSALLLLIVSFLCLGSWVNTFKLTGPRWRFELFSIDFAIGAALVAAIAAFTLGTLGSDLAFTDRMLVAGHLAQVMLICAGFIFNLGNMLLLGSASILGIAAAFPLSVGVALVVTSFFLFRGNNVFFLLPGILLMIVAALLDAAACRMRDRAAARARAAAAQAQASVSKNVAAAAVAATPTGPERTAKPAGSTATARRSRTVVKPARRKRSGRRTVKGLLVAILAGVALGLFYPVADKGMAGEFGLGPYAGVLLFSIGVLVSTIMFNFYFLNIAIEGEPLSFGAYFRGMARQHFLGFGGGALCAGGILAVSLAMSAAAPFAPSAKLLFILPIASVLIVMFWGATSWKEFRSAPGDAKLSIGLTAALFTGSLILFGIGIAR